MAATEQRLSAGTRRHIDELITAYVTGDLARELRELERDIVERGMGIALDEQSRPRGASPQWSDPTPGSASALAESRRLRELRRAGEALDAVWTRVRPEWREMAARKFGRDMTWDQVAAEVGAPADTCRNWAGQLRRMVAEQLGWT